MWRKLLQSISGKDCELRERMLRTIILVGGIATIVGITEIVFVMEVTGILLPMLLVLLLAMAACLFATFKYRRYNLASILLGLIIIILVFPVMFCLSDGINSGAAIWLALGILYIFVMFTGKKLAFFLILSILMYSLTFLFAYFHPEIMTPMPSKAAAWIDSFFSVIVVGITGGIILKANMRVFEEEHKLNLFQKEELEKNSKEKDVLFANISHEIRTPINAIIGLNEMILRSNPTEETVEYAQDIQAASTLLLNQVNDILDLSQMEMNKMQIIPVSYKTKELFVSLAELIRGQAEKKNLELNLDIDKNLPSVLWGDEKRIRQVVLNILDNAVKYTEEGSVTLSVQGEECSTEEVILKIQIADTGIGIRKEEMDAIYDSFKRLDEKKNAQILGSGLGLAITRQLVNLMGGEISVDSIYTKGSVFTVILKQKIIDAKLIGDINIMYGVPQKRVPYRPSFEAPEARILVVDDNGMNRKVTSRLLSATKVQVDLADSGEECLELTKKKYYHVILLDYMMPGMDGTETLKKIRTQENGLCRDAAIIVLTANTMSGSRQRYLAQGFDGYVEKPIFGKLLEAEILPLLPEDIIEYREYESMETGKAGSLQGLARKKRKKICITSDCTCDIPPELLEKYDIKLMYLYIRTPHGRFADTREIDSDSLSQYVAAESSTAFGDSVTVEEFEEFFAERLTEAEQVIHISLASRSGKSYTSAVTAAKGFNHVRIIDSGQLTCGQGLIALYAAKLAMEGKEVNEICDLVEKMKNHVHMRFLMPGAVIFQKGGLCKESTAKICHIFGLHPYATIRQNRPMIIGAFGGSLENAWKHAIHLNLLNKRKICRDVVFITHVGCSVKQQEWIKNEVLKCIPFEKVIMQRTSFTNACNSGLETIAISYYSM